MRWVCCEGREVKRESKKRVNEDVRRIQYPPSPSKLPQAQPLCSATPWSSKQFLRFESSPFPPPSQCSSLPSIMAGRLPVRLLSRQLQRQSRRPFSRSSSALDAHNFYMPAMSPTMTEVGILNWKVKPGDSFQPGDVLVEIETDKATMDVCKISNPQRVPMLINTLG
jgi:hypothetical protein